MTFRVVELAQPLYVRDELCRFQVLRKPADEECEYVAAYFATKEEAARFVEAQA